MSGELEAARVRGLTFTEFQGDIMSLVKSCINKDYVKYPMLKQFGINKEDIEDAVYSKLYNKGEGELLSNMEKYFIKASGMSKEGVEYGPDTKYIVCLVKRVVYTVISQICRNFLRKGVQPNFSLDGSFIVNESSEMTYYKGFGVVEKYEDLHYRDALNQVELIEYPYMVSLPTNQTTKQLTTRVYLDLLVSGYKHKEIQDMLIEKESSQPINQREYQKLRKDIMTTAKRNLKKYIEE